MQTALIIPDCHVPDENKKAYKLMLKIAKDLKPNEIILLGDFADFFTISSHDKPLGFNVVQFLQREVECVNFRLDELDRLFPTAKKVYIEGNHEYRLKRYIMSTAPQVFGLIDCVSLFKLRERPNWTWVPYSPSQCYQVLGSKLRARHEPVGKNSNTTATKAMTNIVFAHTHRIESSEVVAIDQKRYRSFSVGWLGNKNAHSMQYVKNHHQWSLGFGIVYVDEKSKLFYAETIQIMDNISAVFNGRLYK